ncbi:MAG: nitroreductase family protein [Candidatus Aminicenantes bacterium]|nr:nitroreductase family protein [Candidatus Aminicenantes bacterium]
MSRSSTPDFYRLVCSRRSIRQFQSRRLSRQVLTRLVNVGRLAPSAANRQPLEFVVVDEPEKTRQIFSCLKWAAYIQPEGNPRPGHEPVAYIIVLVNQKIRATDYERDVGAALENMILVAWSWGIGSCWLISIDREKVAQLINLPPNQYLLDSVLALGYPAEEPVVEETEDDIRYWKDESGRLHVPKRKLAAVLHWNVYSPEPAKIDES